MAEQQAAKKAPARRVRFKVGADVGSSRYEEGDTALASVLSDATRGAWLDQGLIEWADRKGGD